ncbi:MAG TPA: response regulator transcription factor [Polyangiaceae bacterium]
MSGSSKILIVEDQAPMRRFLRTTLMHNGFEALEAADGAQALERVAEFEPNLVLLDLGLPDIDGIEIICKLREHSDVPIIVISARQDEHEKVEALDLGANDYVTKPFGAAELLARIRVALRSVTAPGAPPPPRIFVLGELRIDFENRAVRLSGQDVHLTPTEYRLLEVLVERRGRAVGHGELLREVWGAEASQEVEYLRTFMRQLRYKLEPEPSQPRYLLTIPRVGYRLKSEV